jgi:hypothetical protein
MNNVKQIALYLPQYHPIEENNKAWGDGFTEWINVKKAQPLFEGHYQPHSPHTDVGYYDLLDPDVLAKQSDIAREHGIYGFAYYHYWFNGKRLLSQPLDNMLSLGKPDFPFCYIWANENWTKRWDGLDDEIIIRQEYSLDDDRNHIRFLCKNVFSDRRYITVDGKPIFIVYRTELLPDIMMTAQIWRAEAKLFGFKDLYLIRVESFSSGIDPMEIGFDAVMEFAPDWRLLNNGIKNSGADFNLTKYDYSEAVFNMLLKKKPYKYFRCVFPSWDNTPRRKQNATVFVNTSPNLFKYFLYRSIQVTIRDFQSDERIIFVNAWNEWGEGCHIEPDERFGFQYLQMCYEAVNFDYNNQEQEIKFYEYLERYIQSMHETNQLLEQRSADLYQKLEHIQMTNDYKIGHRIMKPLRRFKQFIKK